MNRKITTVSRSAIFVFLFAALTRAHGQPDIDLHTVDSGGGTSFGGVFELYGTIGQPDAGILSGGSYELNGGFWSAATPSCGCLGDTNDDGQLNGEDIATFIGCILNDGACQCADIDGTNGVSLDDVDAFVADLLDGSGCQ